MQFFTLLLRIKSSREVSDLLAIPRFVSQFGSFLTGSFDESAEVERVFDRCCGEEVDGGDHEDTGVICAFKTRQQEDCSAPEQAPEAQRDYTFDPTAECVSHEFIGHTQRAAMIGPTKKR